MFEFRVQRDATLRALGGSGDADPMRIEGCAIPYGALSTRIPPLGNREKFAPDAVKDCLARGQDVVCTYEHSNAMPLGRCSNGTLRLDNRASGLYFRCDLPNTQVARDLHASITRGDVRGNSFEFSAAEDDWDECPLDDLDCELENWDDDERKAGRVLARTVKRCASLRQCGPVLHPAYDSTTLAARSVAIPDSCPHELRSRYTRQMESAEDSRQRRRDLLRLALS